MSKNVAVIIRIGEWQTVKDHQVLRDLDPDTIVKAIRKHIRDNYEKENVLNKATQALVWEDSRTHNLIAVYDIRGGNLTWV